MEQVTWYVFRRDVNAGIDRWERRVARSRDDYTREQIVTLAYGKTKGEYMIVRAEHVRKTRAVKVVKFDAEA